MTEAARQEPRPPVLILGPAVLLQKGAELFDVLPHDGFLGRIAEQEGGMVENHEVDVGIIRRGEELAGFFLHREFVAAIFHKILQCDCAEKENHFGLHQLDLAAQIREARLDLLRTGGAVDLGLAFDDIDDEQVAVGIEPDAGHDFVEQFARAPDEGLSHHVFVVAGALANDEEFRIGIAAVDDDVVAGLAARAFLAVIEVETLSEFDVARCRQHVVVRGVE